MSEHTASEHRGAIERLEREKLEEEVRQLRLAGRTRWLTPTALALMLPLIGAFGIWLVSEVKQYGEGYRAITERDALKSEKAALQAQKNGLNLEILALLKLKEHYEAQASSLEADVQRNQQDLDRIYLQATYANSEAGYALGHTAGLPALKRADINKMEAFLNSDQVPLDVARTALELSHQAQLALDLIDAAKSGMHLLEEGLALLPASKDAKRLQWHPNGIFGSDRPLMLYEGPGGRRLYDVEAAEFLPPAEAEKLLSSFN